MTCGVGSEAGGSSGSIGTVGCPVREAWRSGEFGSEGGMALAAARAVSIRTGDAVC